MVLEYSHYNLNHFYDLHRTYTSYETVMQAARSKGARKTELAMLEVNSETLNSKEDINKVREKMYLGNAVYQDKNYRPIEIDAKLTSSYTLMYIYAML